MTDIVEKLKTTDPWESQQEAIRVMGEAADEIERLRVAVAMGQKMRAAQSEYFKSRSRDALIASKTAEAEFDKHARAALEGKQ